MNDLIPAFHWTEVVVEPWTGYGDTSLWVVLMGFLVTAACGLVGNYLLLRRMALIGDAISHSILPGLIAAFVLFKTTALWASMLGAVLAAILTVVLIEAIHRHSRIKPDAAICIVFTTMFAIGVAMMASLEAQGNIHLDTDCVLFGEITFIALEPAMQVFGLTLGPAPVVQMGAVLIAVLVLILLFYKELLITSFDAALAQALGFRPTVWHYGLMTALAIVIVSAFEAVGAILAVAMLIVPPMFAAQCSDRLPVRLLLTLVHAAVSSLIGYHLAVWLQCAAAGAMVVAGSALFLLAWGVTALRQRFRRIDLPDPPVQNAADLPVR